MFIRDRSNKWGSVQTVDPLLLLISYIVMNSYDRRDFLYIMHCGKFPYSSVEKLFFYSIDNKYDFRISGEFCFLYHLVDVYKRQALTSST